MTYDPEIWRVPDDRIWALKECAKSSGMMPNAETTAKFLTTMQLEGLVRRSDIAPVWHITDDGRAELSKLESARAKCPVCGGIGATHEWNCTLNR